jgi:hypothetical protein
VVEELLEARDLTPACGWRAMFTRSFSCSCAHVKLVSAAFGPVFCSGL